MPDGMSQYCPEDVLTKNGKFCHNKGRGVCLFGKCNSHSSQCADIWGDDSFSAHDSCFDLNRVGKF